MIRLLTDRELAARLGQYGKRLVETERNWTAVAGKVNRTLQEITR